MKKTFRIIGLALVATGLLFAGCNKAEEEEDEESGGSNPLEFSVSHSATTKTVLIEELTGNKCVNCPDGHKKANEVKAALGDKCCLINYHIKSSSFADNYATTEGNTFNTNFNVDNDGYYGIPAAMINRTRFDNSVRELTVNRSNYMTYANQIAAQNACANVAARAVIERGSRKLTVRVKAYYTANGEGSANLLNVALIQNNIMGSQSGMSSNPAQVENGQYRHMEMFRAFLTGQWGESISPVTQGSEIDKTYTYTIPETYTDPFTTNTSACVLDDLQVVVFITESSHQNVVNACMAPVTFK